MENRAFVRELGIPRLSEELYGGAHRQKDVMRDSERRGALLVMVVLGALATAGCPGPPHVTQKPWRGLWPQDSFDEAEQAQEAAKRGADRYGWQLAPDGERVGLRYAREELGWENFEGFDLRTKNENTRWRLIRCAPGPNEDYPDAPCAPGRDRIYPGAYITVEQLLRRGEEGLWFVTGVRPTELRQADPAAPEQARRAVARFLETRIRGTGAEESLSRAGRNEFGRANPLYSPAEGSLYADYEIVFVDGPSWPFGSFEVGVRMILSSGAGLEDTLFVGPGRNLHGVKKLLVVHGLRPGLEGP